MMNENISALSDFIAAKAPEEAKTHPVDRYFLEPYIGKILTFNRNDFLVYNLENRSTLYSEYLMLCLPELWEDITVDDLLLIINCFTKVTSFYGLILFTYKFIEIDITELVLNRESVSVNTKCSLKRYLNNQYPNLLKTETDLFFFDNGLYGVKNESWMYIKQKLLMDNRLKPALLTLEELANYFKVV